MSGTAIAEPAEFRVRDRRLRRALRLASLIQVGTLTMVLPDGSSHRIVASDTPVATIVLNHPKAVGRIIAHGPLGLAETYIEGLWDSPDLGTLMALAAANEEEWQAAPRGFPGRRVLSRLGGLLRLRRRSRDLIARYRIGPKFHAAWLDPSVSLSSALYLGDSGAGAQASLHAAQLRKIHRMCAMLRLAPGMRVLEIGCGCGAFAEIAARDYGCSVVAITVSPAELSQAQARIDAAGLGSRVELRLQDFRDVGGSFDRITAIEMLEEIGERNWAEFFEILRERLRKNGVAGLQVVTLADRLFETYRRRLDFVQRHVRRGSRLPTKNRLRKAIMAAGMAWGEEYWFGRDYAVTLSRWQDAFQKAWPRIAASTQASPVPLDERFKRAWEYYLAYRQVGFEAGWTDVGQVLIARNG